MKEVCYIKDRKNNRPQGVGQIFEVEKPTLSTRQSFKGGFFYVHLLTKRKNESK